MSSQENQPCPSCSQMNSVAAKFCASCGSAVTKTEVAAALPTIGGLETLPSNLANCPYEEPATSLNAGDIVAGKFEIERVVGRGGMGVVYKATELVSGQPAALKLISEKYVGSEKAVQRLIDEGVTTRAISHPNIVQIFDIGRHGAQPYIAMEFIEGTPLHVWRGRKSAAREDVSFAVAAQIIQQVLKGLEAAHDRGVIHRDLKPENIMLIGEPTAQSAQVKIVDFGIALATQAAPEPGTGTGLGTQHYMAPEQLRNANLANASADLYSLSKIFYELLVGVLPMGHWQPPSGGRSDVPGGVDKLIEQGLSLNRDVRPQSAAIYRQMLVEAMTKPAGWNATKDEKRAEIKEAQKDLVAAYKRVLQNMPTWAWIVLAVFGLGIIAEEAGWLDTEPACYTDQWGDRYC